MSVGQAVEIEVWSPSGPQVEKLADSGVAERQLHLAPLRRAELERPVDLGSGQIHRAIEFRPVQREQALDPGGAAVGALPELGRVHEKVASDLQAEAVERAGNGRRIQG